MGAVCSSQPSDPVEWRQTLGAGVLYVARSMKTVEAPPQAIDLVLSGP